MFLGRQDGAQQALSQGKAGRVTCSGEGEQPEEEDFFHRKKTKAIKRKYLQMLKRCLRKYITMLIEMSSI